MSLKTEKKRQEGIAGRLDKLGLFDYKFIDGADGRLFDYQQFEKEQDRNLVNIRSGRDMTKSELGCAISHRKAAEYFLLSNERSALIIEDDICINPKFSNSIIKAMQFVIIDEEKPTILTLGPVRKFLNRPRISLSNELDIVNVAKSWGAVGYILNRAAAQEIIKMQTPIRLMADDWQAYSKIAGIKIYGVDPFIIAEASHLQNSILETQRSEQRNKRLGGIFRLFFMKSKLLSSIYIGLILKPIYGIRSHTVNASEIMEWTK